METPARRFRVHAGHSHHGRILTEESFEAAALAYVEAFCPAAEEGEVTVTVSDADTGERHCFRVDLEGAAAGARTAATDCR